MFGLALAGWAVLAIAFVRGSRRRTRHGAVRRDVRGWLGLVVQAVGASLVWNVRRSPATPLIGAAGTPFEVVTVLLAAGLVTAAMMLSWGAFRALGAQWSVGARVRPDHELVTTGSYAHLRHPIYAAFGALLIATGLALSQWPGLIGGVAVYGLGTAVRIRSEEALLRATFGHAYDAYRTRVPAVIPRRLTPSGSRRAAR